MSTAETKKIAFFGAGLMGYPLIEALIDANYPLALWNRTKEKLHPLVYVLQFVACVYECVCMCVHSVRLCVHVYFLRYVFGGACA